MSDLKLIRKVLIVDNDGDTVDEWTEGKDCSTIEMAGDTVRVTFRDKDLNNDGNVKQPVIPEDVPSKYYSGFKFIISEEYANI